MEAKGPQPCKRDCSNRQYRKEVLAREAAHHHHAKPHERNDNSRAKVGLDSHEHKNEPRIRTRDEYVAYVCYLYMPAGKIFCQEYHEPQLNEIGRLEGKA